MKCIELSPKGYFKAWEAQRKEELDSENLNTELGQQILYEDGKIKLWSLVLKVKERIGFRKINCDFRAMSQVDGFAVNHRSTGEIVLVQCKKGEMYRYNKKEKGEQIWDLENIGAEPLEFVVIEYLFDPENGE